MKTFILMALRNLLRNRRRTLSTSLAVAIGFASVVLTTGYVVRVYHFLYSMSVYLGHTGHIQIYAHDGLNKYLSRPSKYSLTPDTIQQVLSTIEKDSRVEHIGRYLTGNGLAGNGCQSFPFFAHAGDVSTMQWVRKHPIVQDWCPALAKVKIGVSIGDSEAERPIALAKGLARKLNKVKTYSETSGAISDPIKDCSDSVSPNLIKGDANIQLSGNDFDGNISMIDGDITTYFSTGFEASNNMAIEATLPTLQKLYATDNLTYLAVFLKDALQSAKIKKQWETTFREKGLNLDLYTYKDPLIAPDFNNTMRFLYTMGLLILLVVVGVVTLGIANSVTMNIIERMKEIGTLRAMGFTDRNLRALFVLESFFLSGMASAAGAAAAYGISAWVNHAQIFLDPPGASEPMQFQLTPWMPIILIAWFFMQFTVMVTTYILISKRSRTNPALLLHGETQ